MPSGTAARRLEQLVEAAAAARRGGAERDPLGGVGAVAQAGPPCGGETGGGARPGAVAAMQAAAAVGHGGLAAGASGPGARAAARRPGEVAGRIAVEQLAKAGGGRRSFGRR